MNRSIVFFGIAFIATIVVGCNEQPKPAAPASGAAPASPAALPAGLFVAATPPGAAQVKDAKAAAKKGEDVVVVGRIGGSKEPFNENRAAFTLVDTRVKACGETAKDDPCQSPWDYCCEPRDVLTANMATIQVVGSDGKPLRAGLEGVSGLKQLATVTVSGRVADAGSGVFVVEARAIHVGG